MQGGEDVNAADENGSTPLFIAARDGDTARVRWLAERGADVDKADNDGRTPLYVAAEEGHTKAVRTLLACGAEVDKADNLDCTPLHAAAYCGHVESMQALVDCGADVNAADCSGETSLHEAAQMGHTKAVRMLVVYGADVNKADNNGCTPLYEAARSGETEMVWTLVRECGAVLDRAQQQKLAFAMALHPRLGQGSRANMLDSELVSMILHPHLRSLFSEVAHAFRKARTANVLRFLEALEGAAPVYAQANAEQRAKFECPVCLPSLNEEPKALALVPCGHQVCERCWNRFPYARCSICRQSVRHAAAPSTWPDGAALYGRICVEVQRDSGVAQ